MVAAAYARCFDARIFSDQIGRVKVQSHVFIRKPFIESSNLTWMSDDCFESSGLPVAEIYSFDEALGIIVQEDLGDTILRDVLGKVKRRSKRQLINDSIGLIARIQSATQSAYDTGSIASTTKV